MDIRPGLPWVALVLFMVGLGLVLEAYFRSRPSIPARRRALLAGLRLAALAVLVLIILDPALTLTSNVSERLRVAVLVDGSRSMGFWDADPASGDTTSAPRIRRAFEILWGPPRGLLESLERRATVRVLQFAEDVRPLEDRAERGAPDDLDAGDQTNLGLALSRAVEWEGGARPDAVVLISDGLSNVGKDPVLVASRLGVPVYAVGIGDPRAPRDVALVRCVTNEVAYVDSRVEVRMDLAASGFDASSVPVRLWEGERLLDSTRVALSGTGQTHRVSLFFTPTEEGVHRYRVDIPPQQGERLRENNQRLVVVSVLKSRMRVYYVEAYPRWDYAFLRRSLERDANIDVEAGVLPGSSGAVLPTPEDMSEVDAFIVGNLPKQSLTAEEVQRLVRAVTEEGKGLCILGGRSGLDYGGTGLEDILPLEVGRGRGRHYEDTFQPVLTPEGALHMVTRLGEGEDQNRRAWDGLPPLMGLNVLGRPKPGAQSLLVHPTQRVDGEPVSVLAVQRVGAGKCAVVSAYTLWRWDFLPAGFGVEGHAYDRFWGNMVRWLVSREDLKRVRLATDRHVYRSGEPIVLRAQVYDDVFRPVDGATVVATIMGRERDGGRGVEAEIVLDPVALGEGHYEGRLGFLSPGGYGVMVAAWRDGVRLGEDWAELAVDTYSLEYQRTAMAENLLRDVSRASGGRYYPPGDAADLVSEMRFERRWVRRVREIRVSNHALLFLLFSGLLFSEWMLRKRSGLS